MYNHVVVKLKLSLLIVTNYVKKKKIQFYIATTAVAVWSFIKESDDNLIIWTPVVTSKQLLEHKCSPL